MKHIIATFFVLLAILPVEAQTDLLTQTKSAIAWLDEVSQQDSTMLFEGAADLESKARLKACDCSAVKYLFEIEVGMSWQEAQEKLREQGYILQCTGQFMGPELPEHYTSNNLFLFEVIREEEINLNDYLLPGVRGFKRRDRVTTLYTVEMTIKPQNVRPYDISGLAIEGPDGDISPYIKKRVTEPLHPNYATLAFWRHITQNGDWPTHGIRPSFVPHLRYGSLYWVADSLGLNNVWGSLLINLSDANQANITANEITHVVVNRHWGDSTRCSSNQDEHKAFEALSDAGSLFELSKDIRHVDYVAIFIHSYLARVAETSKDDYAESERIFRQAADAIASNLEQVLEAAGKDELAWKIEGAIEYRAQNMRELYLDLYFMMDNQEYYDYVVIPLAAEYARLTLERLQELGIDTEK